MLQTTNWKPISTAPRDGTWILICNKKGDMAVGWDKENHPVDDWRIGAMCIFRNPTHWMELPNAP